MVSVTYDFLSYTGGVLDYNYLDIWLPTHLRFSKSTGRRGIISFLAFLKSHVHSYSYDCHILYDCM